MTTAPRARFDDESGLTDTSAPPADWAKFLQQEYAAGVEWGQTLAEREAAQARATGTTISAASESFVLTDALVLRGGAGSPQSYAQKAEETYTRHSYGGESPVVMKALGLLNNALVLARDVGLLEFMVRQGWNHPDASGAIFYEKAGIPPVLYPDPSIVPDRGVPYEPVPRIVVVPGGTELTITAVQLYNQTYEPLSVRYVAVDVLSAGATQPRRTMAYPLAAPILICGDVGEVGPGDLSRIALERTSVPPGSSATVTIGVVSESGRWGALRQEVSP